MIKLRRSLRQDRGIRKGVAEKNVGGLSSTLQDVILRVKPNGGDPEMIVWVKSKLRGYKRWYGQRGEKKNSTTGEIKGNEKWRRAGTW